MVSVVLRDHSPRGRKDSSITRAEEISDPDYHSHRQCFEPGNYREGGTSSPRERGTSSPRKNGTSSPPIHRRKLFVFGSPRFIAISVVPTSLLVPQNWVPLNTVTNYLVRRDLPSTSPLETLTGEEGPFFSSNLCYNVRSPPLPPLITVGIPMFFTFLLPIIV